MTFTCSCGDSYTKAISKTAHNYGSYTYNNDATYESDGTETAVCSVCGDRTTRTAGGTQLVHVHSYSESVTTAPTCTAEGVKTFACSCGSSYTEAIPAAGHAWSDYAYNNDATTESDGTKTRYCTVCGERETVTAEGTRKNLPSWYDEHSQPLNTTTGGFSDGSLEAYFVSGQFSWSDAALPIACRRRSSAERAPGRRGQIGFRKFSQRCRPWHRHRTVWTAHCRFGFSLRRRCL